MTIVLLLIGSSSIFAQVRTGQEIRKLDLKGPAYRNAIGNLEEDLTKDDINGFSIEKAFGDLNGDGVEEAAIFVHYYVGGTGASNRNRVLVFSAENGKVQLLGQIDGGDRADGGIKSAKIQNARLEVQTFTPGPNECAVCYGGVAETSYELISGDFVKVGYEYVADMTAKTNRKTGVTTWVYTPANGRATKKRRNLRTRSEAVKVAHEG